MSKKSHNAKPSPDMDDPFGPPTPPRMVHCLHCDEIYHSSEMYWDVEADLWVCKNWSRCGGAGYGFDIHDADQGGFWAVMLTVREVADRLRVSPTCVYQLIAQRRLACHRIGAGRGTVRVAEEDLDDYLHSCRKEKEKDEGNPRSPRPSRRLKHLRL